ncbi:asparagine synthase (glutamine-hydrolyzing) [Micromonospora rubida]
MSGIAGLVDFARNVAADQDVVRAMTATLARRGPNGEGLWFSQHAALGHRCRAAAGPDNVAPPLSYQDATGLRAALTFAGQAYNAQELRGRLRSLGHDFGTGSDSEVILHAYLEWGPEFVTRIEGTYAVAVWDEQRQEMLLVRDRMGVKPLFYATTPAGVLFGSEPKAILSHPDFQPVVEADGLRDILSVARVPGHAIFRGMHEVRPGCVVRVNRSGTVEQRYWGLRVAEHPDPLDRTISTVREMLESVVAQQMTADVLPCSLLSGGLDSSSLTAIAAQVARNRGLGPVRSLAVNDHDASGATGARGNDDHIYARLLAEHVGTEHSEVSLGGLDLLDPALRASVLAAYDLPINKGDQYASLHLLFGTASRHATVALSGECGDDVFGGYNWQRLPELVFTSTFPWIHEGRPRFRGNDLIFDPGLLAKLDLAAYERDCHATALAEIAAADHLDDPAEVRYREVTYLAHTRHTRVLFDRLDRLGMASGLDIRVPFADHKLVEYSFNIPWAMKSFDGREKSLLRAATQDLLPESVAMRIKTPYPNLPTGSYDKVLRERLVDVVLSPESPIAALLAPELRSKVAAGGATALEDGVSRAALETALQVNSWLQTYDVRVVL